MPHVRQYASVRQALVDAGALETSLAALLENTWSGIVHLDRRGRILAANDKAGVLLRQGDGLSDQGGYLQAGLPADNARLQTLLARALPRFGRQGASGSMTVRRSRGQPRLVLHLSPVVDRELDIRTRRVPYSSWPDLIRPSVSFSCRENKERGCPDTRNKSGQVRA